MLLVATEKGLQVALFSKNNGQIEHHMLNHFVYNSKVQTLTISPQGRVFFLPENNNKLQELSLDQLAFEKGIFSKFVHLTMKFVVNVASIQTNVEYGFSWIKKTILNLESASCEMSKIVVDQPRLLAYTLQVWRPQKKFFSYGDQCTSIISVYDIGRKKNRVNNVRKLMDIKGSDLKDYIIEKERLHPNAGEGWNIIEIAPASPKDHPEVQLVVVFENTCRAFLMINVAQKRSGNAESYEESLFMDPRWRLVSNRLPVKLSQLQDQQSMMHQRLPTVIHEHVLSID